MLLDKARRGKKEGAAEFCTLRGVTMVQVILATKQSRQTLQNWHKNKPDLFRTIVYGVSHLLNELGDTGRDGEPD